MKIEDILIKALAKALEATETENCKLNDQITTLKTMLANVEEQCDAAEAENLRLREEVVSRGKTIDALEERLEQQPQPAEPPTPITRWDLPEQFGLPPGYTINNPANLSPYQIGEGYRIATTVDDANLPHEFFRDESNQWVSAVRARGVFAVYPIRTYRVPADRPLPPPKTDTP